MSPTIESPVLVLDAHSPFVQAAKFQRSDVDVPDFIVDSSNPTYWPAYTIETFTERLFHRMPPLAVT